LQQFEAVLAGHKAFLQYKLQENAIVFTHTEVPKPLEGRGVGSALAKAGLEYAANERLRVVRLCPFVKHYIGDHPEYFSLVEP